MRRAVNNRRLALSMIEMIAATAIMATLMVSVVVLVSSGYGVWTAFEQDIDVSENAYAALRHIVRQLRQADAITAISAPSDTAGYLSYLSADAVTRTWSFDSSSDQILFNNGSGDQLLARSIDQLTFVGYKADGVTQTIVPNEIHLVKCTIQVTLAHGGGVPQTVSSAAWIRSW
jgi:type II secretory pathway pseudopilin PulG